MTTNISSIIKHIICAVFPYSNKISGWIQLISGFVNMLTNKTFIISFFLNPNINEAITSITIVNNNE